MNRGPVIIEAAINGNRTKEHNPNVPRSHEELAADTLETLAAANGLPFFAPPLWLCTDNAAMIAYAGLELFEAGYRDDLSLSARPRWPLDTSSAPMLGSGKKGAKA